MIRTATRVDFRAIRDLLARANDAPYDIDAVAEEKCFGDGVSGAPHVRVFDDGALRGVAVTCGEYLRILAVDRGHRRRGIGTALLEASQASTIGAEPGNYFTPGVLEPEFFLRRGFRQVAQTWNLNVEIGDSRLEIGRHVQSSISNLQSPSPVMLAFVEQHFGATWRFEAQRAQIAHYIDGVGFAVAEANNRGLGSFGPTGVATEFRGKGFGRQLLLACLADLRDLGYSRVIIPWTDAIDFYRKSCGATPAHRFVTLRKSL